MSRGIDLSHDRWDLSDTEAHLLLLHLVDSIQTEGLSEQFHTLSFVHYHFIYVIDLSPSVFSVASDGDYLIYDAIISSLFSILKKLKAQTEGILNDAMEPDIRISVVGFSTVHTPNTRQAFLLCAPLTEESLQLLHNKLIDYLRLLVQLYEPIAKNWLIGETDEQILLIPGLFESDESGEEDDFPHGTADARKNKPTLDLGTSDIAMIDQMRIAHKIAQLTVGRARTVAVFITDGVSDLPTPAATDYLILSFRSTGIPCCFVVAASPNPCIQSNRAGLAPSSYFAHTANRSIIEHITTATNGLLCYVSRSGDGSFDIANSLIDCLMYEKIACSGCQPFDSSSPQQQLFRFLYRKVPVNVFTAYPLVSARFAHGFKKCWSTRPESSTDANMCLRWHPHICIRYFISQSVLEVWLEGEADFLQAVYPFDPDEEENIDNPLSNVEGSIDRPLPSKQTIALQTGKELMRYLAKLAFIDDTIMKIYNTDSAILPADPVVRELPVFVFLPKHRQLVAHESLRHRAVGAVLSTTSENQDDAEDISSFLNYWRNIATMNIAMLKLVFLTRNLQYFLNYDRPLPKVLLTASTPGAASAPRQTSALACRLALNNIVTFLKTSWASFELIENRAFVKFLSDPQDRPCSYCIVKLSDRHSPVVNMTTVFLRGTEKQIIDKVLNELQSNFSKSLLFSTKHSEIAALFPLTTSLESFFIEPNVWLSNFTASMVIPEYNSMLSSIEHSLPARVRPMSTSTILSRIYRANRVVYELVMPGGMTPRSIFNRMLRSMIKRKLANGYRFSSATGTYLCFAMEVDNDDEDEDEVMESAKDSFLKTFLHFNLSYSVEDYQASQNLPTVDSYSKANNSGIFGPSSSFMDTMRSSGATLKPEEHSAETRPSSSAGSLQPQRRMSLAVGVSSVETLIFRIVTELWILPVGVVGSCPSLDKIVMDVNTQDFEILAKLYSYFILRLNCVLEVSRKSFLEKTDEGFKLPPSGDWLWNPPEWFKKNGVNKNIAIDLLSHPVLTLSARPDLYQLLSSSQEVTIRLPLLRCSDSSKNAEAAAIYRDLVRDLISKRFQYSTTVKGYRPNPRNSGFVQYDGALEDGVEWTMFTQSVDRPEHLILMFVPSDVSPLWLEQSEGTGFVCLYLYVSVFDWLLADSGGGSSSSGKTLKPRPADVVIDVAEDSPDTGTGSAERTPSLKRRMSTTSEQPGFGTGAGDLSGTHDLWDIGKNQGSRLADMLASVYVNAVYRCLTNSLPISLGDFELAVLSLCTESVCSEIDLKQLLLLHGPTCPEESSDCNSADGERLADVISQWFQPVPCSPYYHFFKPQQSEEEKRVRLVTGSSTGSLDDSWHHLPLPERKINRDSISSQGSTTASSTSSAEIEDEFGSFDDDSDDDPMACLPPPPLFLHCTCTIKNMKNPNNSIMHVPLSSLPHCLRSLVENSEDEENSDFLNLSYTEAVTLDVICIAPNPWRLPSSVSSTPVQRAAPSVNLVTTALAITEQSSTGMTRRPTFRRRQSSVMVKDSDGMSCFQTLSLHPSQYAAVSSLVKQFHWLIFDSMIMSVAADDLDLHQLATHILDTINIASLSPPRDGGEDFLSSSILLPSFCPLARAETGCKLAFVVEKLGQEKSHACFCETLAGWKLMASGAIVRRLGSSSYFYCALPLKPKSSSEIEAATSLGGDLVEGDEEDDEYFEGDDRNCPTTITAVSSTPCELPVDKNDMSLSLSAASVGDLTSPPEKNDSVFTTTSLVLLPHLRRRHMSAAPLVPLRPPSLAQFFPRPNISSSSSRRHHDAISPLGLSGNLFMSPQKSDNVVDSLSTSSERSVCTGRGYESDSELTTADNLEDFAFTSESPIGVHTSQTCWIFCHIGHKEVKFFLYVPWLSRNSEKGAVSYALLNELKEAVDKCLKRTNQELLLKYMHSHLIASTLMLQGDANDSDAAMRQMAEVHSDVKLADELKFPPEHFACPVQYTHRFYLHPSLRLGATAHHVPHQSGRSALPSTDLSDSQSATTPAGRALTVFRGFLRNVAVLNRRDVFTYSQPRESPASDLLYYLIFTSGQTNVDERFETESLTGSSANIDVPVASSIIHRDMSASLAVSLSRSSAARLSSATPETLQHLSTTSSVSLSQPCQHTQQWWLDMHVHGLDSPNIAELDKLVVGLQHALDKAVLQYLLLSLLKNPMHRLTPSDVDFIQHSQQPVEMYYTLPSIVAQSSPQAWFNYFRQTFLSSYAHVPHFSLTPGLALTAESASAVRFLDNTIHPPGQLDPKNTFLFFTRMEAALSGIGCVNISLVAPTISKELDAPAGSFSSVDWLNILATSSSATIVTEHLKGFSKTKSLSLHDWNLVVRVWERGTVTHDLELAIERCISSAISDMITEGIIAEFLSHQSSRSSLSPTVPASPPNSDVPPTSSTSFPVTPAASTGHADGMMAWMQLKTFLDYVHSHMAPSPAPINVKKFTIPLMRVGFWIDVACRALSPSSPSSGSVDGVHLYCSQPGMPSGCLGEDEGGEAVASLHTTDFSRFRRLALKELRNYAASHRKTASSHWVICSSALPAEWQKHSSSQPPVVAFRQCFAVIHMTPLNSSSCCATVLLYNVVPQRSEHLFGDLESAAKVGSLQMRCGSDIALQKAGLFAVQYMASDKPSTPVGEMVNTLAGKFDAAKQAGGGGAKSRNMSSSAANTGQQGSSKQEPWMLLPYGRIVLRDLIALPNRPVNVTNSNSGYITDAYADFCRQIAVAAESINRRREAVIFAGKIVQSLESFPDDTVSSALKQLQQQQSTSIGRFSVTATVNEQHTSGHAKSTKSRQPSERALKRSSSNRLHAIRSTSSWIATLDSSAVNILRHSCRLQHFISAPLALSPRWRAVALARTAHVISSQQQVHPPAPLPVEELQLYTWFRDEYIAYIQRSLFLFELSVTSGGGNSNLSSQHTPPLFSFLSTPGGLVLVQCDLRGVDLHLRLYTWERYRASPTATARFLELVDRCRTMTHLHSFCYDQHVRIVQSWVLDGQSLLPPTYDHAAIIRDLCSVYCRTPLYAASLICSGRTEINGLRFMTSRELINRLANNIICELLCENDFELTVRHVNQVPIEHVSSFTAVDPEGANKESSSVLIPELVLAGRERSGTSNIISTTLTATLRPAIIHSDSGTIEVSDTDLEILFAVATTTKRWKELFPVDTRSLSIHDLMSTKGPKRRAIAPDLMEIALALPRYRASAKGEFPATISAAASLRAIAISCYRQGLADSQWRRITSAADFFSEESKPTGEASNHPEMIACADLRALTIDMSKTTFDTQSSTSSARTTPDLTSLSVESVSVSIGCQALPLSVVDSRLARLRLASPTPSLARALRHRFPLTVWLPGPPASETRPEFTLIISQDRMCAVVIAWMATAPPSTAPAPGPVGTPAALAKQQPTTSTPTAAPRHASSSALVASPESATAQASARKPLAQDSAAQLFFLSRHSTSALASHDQKPVSPTDPGFPPNQSYSLYSNPSHRHFTESIISCLAADYVRHLLDRATPGKS